MSKTCFVIMGYGIKNNINLDLTYNKIIKPCIIENELVPYPLHPENQYNAYRCDEIAGSTSIDYKFVTCLSEADIVIADISTMNANAIYELGARHALQPRSTILLCAKEKEHEFKFFDITYVPIIFYDHEGMNLDEDAIKETKKVLNSFLDFAIHSQSIIPDNPIQRALHEKRAYQIFVPSEQKTLHQLYSEGRNALDNQDYESAAQILTLLYSNDESEENLLLLILAKYKKAEMTNSCKDLIDCIEMINSKIDVNKSTSEYLLGRIAAICLRLYNISKDSAYYYEALEYYRKGANYCKQNFYCPRNYCALLLRIHEITDDANILNEYYYTAKHYSKLFLKLDVNAMKSGNYEKHIYCFYNTNDMKAIVAGKYSDYEKIIARLETDKDISKRQRDTIRVGLEMLSHDITEMNKKTKLF